MSFAQTVGNSTSLHISALGDSLTVGYMVGHGYFHQFLARLRREYPDCNITAENHGICGDTARGGLRRFTQASHPVPQLAIVQFGLNDAFMGIGASDFQSSLQRLVAEFQRLDAQVLLVPPPVLRDEADNSVARPFIQAHVAVAKATGALVADIAGAWEAHSQTEDLWLFDGVHPSEQGYTIMADAVWSALVSTP